MTDADMETLAIWQVPCETTVTRKLGELWSILDDLASLAHTRDGVKVLAGDALKAPMRRLHDLYLDTRKG